MALLPAAVTGPVVAVALAVVVLLALLVLPPDAVVAGFEDEEAPATTVELDLEVAAVPAETVVPVFGADAWVAVTGQTVYAAGADVSIWSERWMAGRGDMPCTGRWWWFRPRSRRRGSWSQLRGIW